MDGRLGGSGPYSGPYSGSHILDKRFHDAFENPEGGRLGFSPVVTLSITVAGLFTSSNGRFPVKTYQGHC